MPVLSVNVNKFATLRNSRGGNHPDVLKAAKDCLAFGAHGITVHPRPDQRHIRRGDVYAIAAAIEAEFNIEGYPSHDFLSMAYEVKPAQVTLVPDAPGSLTSNAGWNTIENKYFLRNIIRQLQDCGIRTSLFLEPSVRMVEAAADLHTDRVELYTEAYAKNYERNREEAIEPYIIASEKVSELGLGLNAGHDLNLDNLAFFSKNIPNLLEVSIGHALICDAIYLGLETTVRRYLSCLE